ncbi:MAG: metallophosphoesterase [Promethearchaeota archaeon]
MENNTRSLDKKKLIWPISQLILSILPILIIIISYPQLSALLMGDFQAVIYILIIDFCSLTLVGLIPNCLKIFNLIKNRELHERKYPKHEISLWIWTIWQLLLGIIFLATPIVVYTLYDEDIGSYATVFSVLTVFLIGFGLTFTFHSVKTIIERIRKRKIPNLKKEVLAYSLLIFLLIPSLGMFYYVKIYLPDSKYSKPMNRGPFLFWRNDTTSTIVIAWDSLDEKNYEVKWGTSQSSLTNTSTPEHYPIYAPSSGAWDSGASIGYRYYVELSGLMADTQYFYTIPDFISKVYSFKTAPSTTKAFSFQVIGDTRRPNSQHRDLVELMTNTEYGDAKFVINVGDTCNNELLDWNQFFDEIKYQANTRPYMVAIGNHEYGNEFGYYFNYANTPNKYFYSFNYSNAHFLIIDNFDGSGGWVSAEQKQFITQDLQRNAGKHDWIFVAFHVPIFSTGDFNYDSIRESDFMPLFTQYGVDVVLTGHDHHYESFNVSRTILESKFGAYGSTGDGMMHFVSGGGGAPLDIAQCTTRPIEPWQALHHNSSEPGGNWQKYFPLGADESTANYTVKDIQIYGELCYQFIQFYVNATDLLIKSIRIDGSIIETFHLQK